MSAVWNFTSNLYLRSWSCLSFISPWSYFVFVSPYVCKFMISSLITCCFTDWSRKPAKESILPEVSSERWPDLHHMRRGSLSFSRLVRTNVPWRSLRESWAPTREPRRRERRCLVLWGRWGLLVVVMRKRSKLQFPTVHCCHRSFELDYECDFVRRLFSLPLMYAAFLTIYILKPGAIWLCNLL